MRSALLAGVVVAMSVGGTVVLADAPLPGMPAGKPAPPAEAAVGCVSRDRLAVPAHPKLRVICDVLEANGYIVDPSSPGGAQKLAADLKRLHLARSVRVAHGSKGAFLRVEIEPAKLKKVLDRREVKQVTPACCGRLL